jgi:hypothetical protein
LRNQKEVLEDGQIIGGWFKVDLDFFYKKNIHARITIFSFHFKIFSLYTDTLFPSWQVTDANSTKGFILTAQPVHYQFEISVLVSAPSLVQTNKITGS